MSRYLEPIEVASREGMQAFQLAKLQEQVQHAYANSPFYRRKFDQAGVKPEQIQSLDDLRRLPFTTKEDLKESQAANGLFGDFLAVPLEQCLRLHQTSGTTGHPVRVLDTEQDWYGFYHMYARALYAMGVRKSDVVVTFFSHGPWIGYWSGFHAAQDLGCLVIPTGGMSTEQRIQLLLDFPITVVGCTPSYALYMAEEARKKGIDLARDTKVRITWHTGEPGAGLPGTKRQIEQAFGAKCFDLPGLTEIAAWGFECEAQSGMVHAHEDYVYPEVLNPETGEPVKPGERGELVFTSLYRKAMPFLRYRTKDIVELSAEPCPCGRTLVAFKGGVVGRTDDMKKVRGVIVYPSRIEEVVRQFDEVDEFFITIHRVSGLDDILVQIDPRPGLSADTVAHIQESIADALRVALGIRATVEMKEPGTLPRWDHKAKRFKDIRTEVPF
ncbi:MAG TPA: phenylacetate--CoA ligase [Symbiobacteriaceae bacterium]|nr:phenylacetate--CoA ligase [Symbiobacteriaceae bacterium]